MGALKFDRRPAVATPSADAVRSPQRPPRAGPLAADEAPERELHRSGSRRRTSAPGAVLAVASLGVFMAFVDATIVNIAFPDIERSFPTTGFSGVSWVLNAYNIVFAALLVGAGRMADLLGRRRTFAAGISLFTLASAACAAAPSPELLVSARVFQALGAAVLVPCSLALVLQAFPDERRSHAVALWTAVAALAAGVGPSLGGVLVTLSDWRLVFLVNLPIGLLTLALARRVLVESRAPGRRRTPDLVGALVLVGGMGLLTLAIVKGPDWQWMDARVLGAFSVAVALLALFVLRCGRQRVPALDLDLFRVRTFAVANLATVLGATGFFAYTLCNVLFLTSVWRYSVLQAGLAITPGPFVAVALARPASELAERVGQRWLVCAGGLLWAAGLCWFLVRVGQRPAYVSAWLPGMVLLGLGAGAAFPNLSSAAVASAPGEQFATATAINSVARALGASLGVALLVAIVGTPHPADALGAFERGWAFAAACFGLVAATALGIGRVRSARSAAPDALPDVAPLPAMPMEHAAPQRARRVPSSATPAEFLRGTPLFAEIGDELCGRIAGLATREQIRAGSFLFRQGESAGCLYLLRSGRLEVVKEHPEYESIRTLERGAVIGELAVLTGSPRSASVRALRDSELLRIDRADFDSLLSQAPALSLALTRSLSRQVQASRSVPPARRPLPSTIAFVPLQRDLRVAAIVEAVGRELAEHGSVAWLSSEHVEAGEPDPVSAFGPIVDEWEAESEHVLLVAGPPCENDPWTEFCLGRADRVVALTRGGAVPSWLADQPSLTGCELAGYDVAPGSRALTDWIETLRPAATHRVESGIGLRDSAGLLARRLAGRAIGLVLSGGGARAFAHLGVLEELERAGVRIDRIGGVSMGAFIGAQVALGRDIEEIDACCYEEWVRRNPINDFTIPRAALIRGDKGAAMVERIFGTVAIEELERPFYAASADLRRSELVVHRHGGLATSLMASLSLPILAPPRCGDGRMLIDGSLLDNLPVEPMAAGGEGPVIAVDVKPAGNGNGNGGAGHRDADRVPPLGETVARLLQLASTNTQEASRRHADLTIRVPVEGIGLLEFHQIDAAREAGRRAAHAALVHMPADVLA